MASLVIKNLPDELHAMLKQRAARHHRSMTKEAVFLLEEALAAETGVREPPPAYRGGFAIDDDFLDKAKREGRS